MAAARRAPGAGEHASAPARVQILVVGSGAGGATTAAVLAESGSRDDPRLGALRDRLQAEVDRFVAQAGLG